MTEFVIDKFNSDTKSTGDLNGQDGWSGSTHFDVQNTTKQEGDQAVINTTAPGGPDRFVELPITARTSGIFSFWLRRDSEGSGTNQLYAILEDGATQHSTIRMDTASNAVLFQGTGTAFQNIGTWTVSEWGHAEIRVDNVAETIEGRWNDGEWTEHSRAFTEIDQIHVGAYNDEAIDLYIDNITYNDGIDVVAKPQTSNIITFDNF